MSKHWDNITAEDVLKAIEIFDTSHKPYPEPRNTFLIYNDKKYPAKHIRGMAYYVANKQEISKQEYEGGEQTVKFFTKLGFQVEYHKNTIKPKLSHNDAPERRIVTKPDRSLPGRSLSPVSQKNALQRLLQKHYGHIETEKKFDWLRTPDQDDLPSDYLEIVTALSNYRQHEGFKKSDYPLSCDIVIEKQKIIIEYDERQHFSKARRKTLEHYPENIHLHYSKEIWMEACDRINAIDNDPIDRDERRAYYDTVRDIEAYRNGYKLLRIKHGDYDWEEQGAEMRLKNLLAKKYTKMNAESGKHKIARLIVTGKDYDEYGNPNNNRLNTLIEKFISKYNGNQQFEYIVTPGGFLTFKFPQNIRHGISIPYAEKHLIISLQQEAERTIKSFFKGLSTDIYIKLKEIADYFTIGIDGKNPMNKQHIELVAVYDLKKEEVIRWTGKFYPVETQKDDLIKINDLSTHFIKLNNQNVVILGCHDLNVYNPRGQKAAREDGWRKIKADKFKKLCKEFNPDIILQHPHKTFSPKNWSLAWGKIKEELPNVLHFASGINYQKNKETDTLRPITKVLEQTQKGDVVDFYL